MYIFRRAAARAISAPRQIRAAPRIASFQSSIPSLSRSFHQSRIWRAEEQKETTSSSTQDAVSESSGTTSEPLGQSEHQSQNVAESASESTKTPSSTSSPQDAVSESSGTTSEPVGQSEQSKPVTEQASELAEKAKETVSGAAAKAAQAVGEVTQQPKEKAQEVASEVSEQAQSAASSMARATRNTARSARDAVDGRNPFTQGVTPPSKILYIGNLFFEVTAPQLEAEFGQYGEIVNSRVVTDNRGLSKGFAYVEMATQKEADAALAALNQKAFQGRRMSVQYHKRRTANNNNANQHDQNKPSKTLFIGNMSYQMSDRDLNDLFRQIRNVLDVRVAIDRRSGQPRGFAHADFVDVESATKAKDILEQKVVYGRQLRVNYSGQSPTDARNHGRENRAPREDRSRDFD